MVYRKVKYFRKGVEGYLLDKGYKRGLYLNWWGEDCFIIVDVLLFVNCFLSFYFENCYLCICELF